MSKACHNRRSRVVSQTIYEGLVSNVIGIQEIFVVFYSNFRVLLRLWDCSLGYTFSFLKLSFWVRLRSSPHSAVRPLL